MEVGRRTFCKGCRRPATKSDAYRPSRPNDLRTSAMYARSVD